MVIRNVQELAQVRTRLINWRRFEKHVGKLLDFWCMSEPALLLYVDSVIKQMEEEIEIYERRRCTSAEETQIDLHAMQLLRHIDRTGMYLIKARVRLGWSQKELSDAAENDFSTDQPVQARELFRNCVSHRATNRRGASDRIRKEADRLAKSATLLNVAKLRNKKRAHESTPQTRWCDVHHRSSGAQHFGKQQKDKSSSSKTAISKRER